ncbi:DUF6932 family protein [Actinomadura sp. 3N508]|uniref:DUF6932 family protein n=1 Tax=Actinomadura sp. 3N508 TaxID=3375153 RepID=UPI0037BA5AF5
MLPPLTSAGVLPSGVHEASWDEVVRRFGGSPRREWLLVGLLAAAKSLRAAKIDRMWLGGSFVTAKEDPTDWDGAWDPVGADLTKIDPVFIDLADLQNGRYRQKAKYGGELLAGFELASGLSFCEFFQHDENGDSKGIVLLDLRTLP